MKMAVQIEKPEKPIGLAFVMHGRGGFKEQPYVRAFVQPFLTNNYTVITFDATKSLGESEGSFGDCTLTDYYADLEDVIAWSKAQSFYREPFILCGHSLGAMCATLYAENNSGKIKALAPISSMVSGRLDYDTYRPEDIADWRKTGWQTTIGYSSGKVKKLKWSHMEDLMKYDLLPEAHKLTMPVLLMSGEFDGDCKHQEILLQAIPGPKELHIIPGAPHTFKSPEDLKAVAEIMDQWIKALK